ncbi:hypothetical protein [Erythrobacter sp. HKB08]|uniref:hypothetical protein n=1 Tax=Erythrobacter sp. HKB08 TaxID=2502843 RepID=UPI001008C70B|nr:hypothetical protein [Erythrobacter sp. HKB08]
MRKIETLTLAAALCAAPAYADNHGDKADKDSKGEAELAELLEGYVAGEPVDCLSRHERDRMQIIDRTAIVYRDGDTIYVNRPRGAGFLDKWDVPVFRVYGTTKICRNDQVELVDRATRMAGPVIVLGDFVPYTKPDNEEG